jgi:hypothetical protein
MTWRIILEEVVDDDVAPTSLNEGRGEVVFVTVLFRLGLKRGLVVGWAGYGQNGERAAQMRKGENSPFWEGRETGFSVALALVVPRTSRAQRLRVM